MIRINQYLARSAGVSRRKADELIETGRVMVNGTVAAVGQHITESDVVAVDDQPVKPLALQTIAFHKPVGYVCSRRQQGNSPTIYALLPEELHHLNPVGRLDKDSSGLLLLSNDGEVTQRFSHPSLGKWKRYYIEVGRPLDEEQLRRLNNGVNLDDGLSRLIIEAHGKGFIVKLQEGRNRQIRRTVEAVGSKVTKLHRQAIDRIELGSLKSGEWRTLNKEELA